MADRLVGSQVISSSLMLSQTRSTNKLWRQAPSPSIDSRLAQLNTASVNLPAVNSLPCLVFTLSSSP